MRKDRFMVGLHISALVLSVAAYGLSTTHAVPKALP